MLQSRSLTSVSPLSPRWAAQPLAAHRHTFPSAHYSKCIFSLCCCRSRCSRSEVAECSRLFLPGRAQTAALQEAVLHPVLHLLPGSSVKPLLPLLQKLPLPPSAAWAREMRMKSKTKMYFFIPWDRRTSYKLNFWIGRSVRNISGISDSRERALGEDAENGVEHRKGDLRKSLSHPHSLTVPAGPAGSTCQTQYRGLTGKHTPLCKFLSTSCCLQLLRPGWVSGELCTKQGWRGEPHQLPLQTWCTGMRRLEKMQLYRTLLTLSSSGTWRNGIAAANTFRNRE